MARVWLSLGSNIEPEAHLAAAISALRQQFSTLDISPVYRCPAVGFDGPAFLNLAVGLDTKMSALALDTWLHALEDRLGRRRDGPRFSSRTLDIDLLLYDDQVLTGPGHLRLPRPDLVEQAFVLRPMADIAPHLVHPTLHRPLIELWQAFTGPDELEALSTPPWAMSDYNDKMLFTRGGEPD